MYAGRFDNCNFQTRIKVHTCNVYCVRMNVCVCVCVCICMRCMLNLGACVYACVYLLLSPKVLCPAKLVDESTEKDEKVLEEDGQAWIHHFRGDDHKSPEKDPCGCDQ